MPDLNSVPPSPRVLAVSRQTSSGSIPTATTTATSTATSTVPTSTSAPAPATLHPAHGSMPSPNAAPAATAAMSPASIHLFPSNQLGGVPSASTLPSPFYPPAVPTDHAGVGVGTGPGPLRHPRPLTAAELVSQLEKEQEAVVNRLTRELTLLRAQNASVVSNASSTSASASASASEPPTPAANLSSSVPAGNGPADHLFSGTTGFSIPSSTSRHNRTYSNTSARSMTSASGGPGAGMGLAGGVTSVPGGPPSIVGITAPAPIRPTAPNLSRQNSTTSRRSRSRANSPGPLVSSPQTVPGTARYDEAMFYRAELDSVKRENEALRRRIRELERLAAQQSQSQQSQSQQSQSHSASRSRSTSVSTTASHNATAASTAGSSTFAHAPVSSAAAAAAAATAQASGAHITARRDGGLGGSSGSQRGPSTSASASMLSITGSTTGSVGVGVPEDEVRVGESAASAGLPRGRTSVDQTR